LAVGAPGDAGDSEDPKATKRQFRLEKKSAALLAYLALEGPTARSRLAKLLWPDTEEEDARNNLRQTLLRLRKRLGAEYVEGRDTLRLRADLDMDLLQLRAALKARDDARIVLFDGELLEDEEYRDCDELTEWLEQWRQELKEKWLGAMQREAERKEQERQYLAALDNTWQMLKRERTYEPAFQIQMRMHFKMGNRTAALEAYRQCKEVLKSDLQVTPSEETSRLAHTIEISEPPRQPVAAPGPTPSLPAKPPSPFVGREHVLAQMEQAYAARKPMFVDGVAGIGKSRLVAEFASVRGRVIHINARPGDLEGGAFHTHRRCLSQVLEKFPEAEPSGWVRRELSRLVPRLQPRPLPLPSTPQERARLFDAIIEFVGTALRDVSLLIFDDGQYMDRDSAELGIQVHSEFLEETAAGRFPLIINVFRTAEIREDWKRQMVEHVLSSGLMQRVSLDQLDAEAVRVMLRGMGDPRLEPLAEEITAYCGGNPLFIEETVQHLLSSGKFDGTFPRSMPPPGRVGPIIEQRLKLLSKEARELAQVFAVAQTDFSAELAACVMGVSLGQLAAPWRELEEAHIFRGLWFIHDIVGEIILTSIPEAIRKDLAARIAACRGRL
jgi:DNA-binding SARP family transcriptional activator